MNDNNSDTSSVFSVRSTGWALLACLICSAAVADDMQRGVNLTLWNSNVDLTQLGQSLDKFKADGGQYVAVNVWWFQDNVNSTVIQPNYSLYSADDAAVVSTIAAIQARGLKVALKPLVDLSNDPTHWRGEIAGGNTWFTGANGYDAFIDHFAGIAAAKNVDLFEIGTELSATTSQAANWTNVITNVRAQGYTGKLTYAANADTPVVNNNVTWWDKLDYIGIDAYYPLASQADPSLSALKTAWASQANTINTWWNGLAANQKKPILFTEVGYASQSGASVEPWSNTISSTPDQQEQANCYTALFSQLWEKEPWFRGTYWWNWEVVPDPGPNYALDYTPQDKLAEGVMKSYYTAQPLPGDANEDGTVNGADLNIVLSNYNQTGMTWSQGDFDGNGTVNGADLNTVLSNYNQSLDVSSSTIPVPEPLTLVLLVLGLLAYAFSERFLA